MNVPYEFIVVGSGAGGAAAAYVLTAAGRQVLLLEKGERLPRDGSTLDPRAVLSEGRFRSREPWFDGRGRRLVPEEYFNLGGKTRWYGAALARFGEDEFGADPAYGCLPWPIGYAELAPYYAEAERLLGVRCFDIEPTLRVLVERLAREGWQAEALPLALAPEILDHAEELAHFDGFASARGLKADAESRLLARVATVPNLRIVTGAPVVELLPARERATRIAGVVCVDGRRFHGRRVLLAAGALHSPRILARYLAGTGRAPRLPRIEIVGAYYKRHLLTAVLAFRTHRPGDTLRKTALLRHERFPHSTVQPLGGRVDRDILAARAPRLVPAWLVRALGERVYGFFLQTEDGSDARNRVYTDEAGRARLDHDPARRPQALAEHRALVRGFRTALARAGMVAIARPIGPAGTAHACGTLVMGNDPATSVVDADGQVHGAENLYVVDGSVLPRASRVNPALTVYAWGLRVAHQLEQRTSHERGTAELHPLRA